jgi:hypothetical protein
MVDTSKEDVLLLLRSISRREGIQWSWGVENKGELLGEACAL